MTFSSLDKLARRNEASDLSSLVERSSEYDGLWIRDIEEDSLFARHVSSRSVEHVEEIMLVRRESVGAKIKHAFQVSQLNVWVTCIEISA